jgi:hypothetical protein
MMPPITIMVASKRPSRRASPGCDLAEESETSMVAILLFEEEPTIHEITLTSTNSPWCDFVKFRGSILFGCDFYLLNRRMLFLISAYHRIFAALPDNFLLSLIGVSKIDAGAHRRRLVADLKIILLGIYDRTTVVRLFSTEEIGLGSKHLAARAESTITAGLRPEFFAKRGIVTVNRRLLISILAFLILVGFGVRVSSLSAEGLSEDELNKLQAVGDYRAHGLTSANSEHPLLMKALLTASMVVADKWNSVPSLGGRKRVSPE